MSLSQLRKLDEDGVTFRSHIDGSYHKLTPEKSIEIQQDLGSNITMAFDECTPFPVSEEEAERSMLLSMRWAERSKQSFNDRDGFGLFGIVQGSIFESLRIQSAEKLKRIGFDGYAVGGLAVGEGHETMINVLKMTVPCLPEDKPRYLMVSESRVIYWQQCKMVWICLIVCFQLVLAEPDKHLQEEVK